MNEFFSLSLALEDWFELPFSALPDLLRNRVELELLPLQWNQLSADRRRSMVLDSDYRNDPNTKQDQKFWWDFYKREADLNKLLAELEAHAPKTLAEIVKKEDEQGALKQALAQMEAQRQLTVGDFSSKEKPTKVKIATPQIRPTPTDMGSAAWRKQNAAAAANAKHNKPGGSRDKQRLIREIWARGIYASKDICAEQECVELDMSFKAARRALINQPKPTRC